MSSLFSQENIFKPLGMKASFYLTPDIKERLVDLTYRRGDKLEPWAGQTTLIEQDPCKGIISKFHFWQDTVRSLPTIS